MPGTRLQIVDGIVVCAADADVASQEFAAALGQAFAATASGSRAVVVDMSGAARVDGGIPGLLAHFARTLAGRGVRLLMVAPPPPLFGMFVELALSQVVLLFPMLEHCMRAARGEQRRNHASTTTTMRS